MSFFDKIDSSGDSISFDPLISDLVSPLGHMIHCGYFLSLESDVYAGINDPEIVDTKLNRKDHQVNKKFIKISR